MDDVRHIEPDAAAPAPQSEPTQSEPAEAAPNAGRLFDDIRALETVFAGWPDEQRNAASAHGRAIEELNAEAFRRLISAIKTVPGAGAALREAAADELVYAVLRHHGILKPSLSERVESALDTVRPMLASHGGDVELVGITGSVAEVRFLGACDGCPASALTFYGGVKTAIQDNVPEISDIKQVKGLGGGSAETVHFVSPFALFDRDGWIDALGLEDLGDVETQMVEVEGESVLLSRFGDKVTCFTNSCAHMGLPLHEGPIEDGLITCPFHGFQYSLESGECLTAPEVQLTPQGVRVVGNRIEVLSQQKRPARRGAPS